MSDDATLALACICLALGAGIGAWSAVRVRRWLVMRGWLRGRGGRPADLARPDADGKGWGRTALYVVEDHAGFVSYVGITSDLRARMRQHAASGAAWTHDVARIRAAWMPDRYAALAAEWALIDVLNPPGNRHPSGSCDAWTEPRPAIVRARVTWPGVIWSAA